MDSNLQGVVFIEIFFVISMVIGYGLLLLAKSNKKFIVQAMILSLILHFIGAVMYWKMSIYLPADANWYFYKANFLSPDENLIGTNFIIHLVYWLRNLLFNTSYLGTYSFFAMIGFLGSVIYLILFNKFAHEISYKGGGNFLTKKIKLFSFFIACWPSSMFWTSSIGKDSLCYFLIALFFLFIFKIRSSRFYLFPLLISAILIFLIRPYLFLVFLMGFVLWLFFSKKRVHNIFINLFYLAVFCVTFFLLYSFMMHFMRIESFTFNDISNRALEQQHMLSSGTYIPMPTNNPNLVLIFLPYIMFTNLFFPLFIFAQNIGGMFASFENVVLILLTIKFVKQYKYWKILAKTEWLINYLFWYFISGMAMLSLSNTNLGLAFREKLMYLPVFLMIIFLVLAIDKQNKVVNGNFNKVLS